jgi:hypothetical protein
MSTKTEPPQVTYLKFSELVVDTALSGRQEKEIKANAKELAPIMEAKGEWDAMQPGQFFIGEDGKKYLCAGFTRMYAAESLGWKGGYFFDNKDTPVARRYLCILTNAGKAVSLFEQGRIFAQDYNGVVADDFAGALADKKNPKDWKIQPATLDEIGVRVGKTGEHIRKCILIFESEPEIAELLLADKISAKIIPTAAAWAKGDDAKQLRILKAAIRAAGDEKATSKHMEIIKPDFVKLKAKTGEKEDKGSGGDPTEREDKGSGGDPTEREDKGSGGDPTERELNIGAPAPSSSKPPTQKETKTIRESVIAIIAKYDSETGLNSMSDEDLGGTADALIGAGLIVTHLPKEPF